MSVMDAIPAGKETNAAKMTRFLGHWRGRMVLIKALSQVSSMWQ